MLLLTLQVKSVITGRSACLLRASLILPCPPFLHPALRSCFHRDFSSTNGPAFRFHFSAVEKIQNANPQIPSLSYVRLPNGSHSLWDKIQNPGTNPAQALQVLALALLHALLCPNTHTLHVYGTDSCCLHQSGLRLDRESFQVRPHSPVCGAPAASPFRLSL